MKSSNMVKLLLLSTIHSVEGLTFRTIVFRQFKHSPGGWYSESENKQTENRTSLNFLHHVHKLGWGIAYRLGEEKITVGIWSVIYVVISEKERVDLWTLLSGSSISNSSDGELAQLTREEVWSPMSLSRIKWVHLTRESLVRRTDE